uniref:PAP-associated domain-containing protein n=1 Tax=Caenorhabditis tropicalis TaxID=1561998 RepID=A0A1I7T4G3_9PELO
MDIKRRIASSHLPSTSKPLIIADDSGIQKTAAMFNRPRKSLQQEQPCSSNTFKNEPREFGYMDALPFAPWRRKRYGLTVQGLHEEIVDMYHWIKPNEIESKLRERVYTKVKESVTRRWSHKDIKISMFGSLCTNLFLPTSDIDVLVECDDWVGTQGDWLSETARGLEQDNIAESVSVYGGAFVPIVKMVDRDTRLSIDISFNTVQGVRAASYIEKVKAEFPLIEPLVLLLKQFLHYRNLNQTFTGGLSSYGLILLLVNFFQLYALNMRHRTIYDREVNLGHLLLRFLELYSLEFNYEEIGISPGQCCYFPKSAAGSRYGHKRAQHGSLALEDPLHTANDVGRSTYNFSSIANAFGQAFQILLVAVTLRERKGQNQLATKGYKGSLLHMIMPFTSKELTYRNWLMSGVMSMPSQDNSVTYDLNQLHNTLVSPMVDLSRYAWLRKTPTGTEKRDAKPLKIINPIDVKKQVMQQLQRKLMEEKLSASRENKTSENAHVEKIPVSTSEGPTSEEEEATKQQEETEDRLILTGPPLPTSTASVNTSATVSTAASISEREDSDSPGFSSSLGALSSEEDDDDSETNGKKKISTKGNIPTQFKKQFSEVVAQSKTQKEFSKKTQTSFDDRKMINGFRRTLVAQVVSTLIIRIIGTLEIRFITLCSFHTQKSFLDIQNHQQFVNELNQHHFYRQPNVNRVHNFIDYAAAAASCGSHKQRQTYSQRNRQIRNHSQGSDGSDGYNGDRWNSCTNNSARGRRGGRAPSNSSNRSRHSSDSRSRGRLRNHNFFPIPPPVDVQVSPNTDITLTEDGLNNSTITEPRIPTMYSDAVKRKTSVSTATNTPPDLNAVNGNSLKNGSAAAPTLNTERSYRNALAIPLTLPNQLIAPSLHSQSQPNLRKDNECGFDTKSAGIQFAHSADLSHQPQLILPMSRIQR